MPSGVTTPAHVGSWRLAGQIQTRILRRNVLKKQLADEQTQRALRFLRHVSADKDERLKLAGTSFPPPEYEGSLWEIAILNSLITRVYEAHMRSRHGLPVLEWQVLEAAGFAAGVTAAQLVDYWVYDKTTVSRAIQSLKKAGLLQTRPHATDKRSMGIYLTKKGHEAFVTHTETKMRFRSALAETVSKEEISATAVVLRKLIDHFRSVLEVSSRLETGP